MSQTKLNASFKRLDDLYAKEAGLRHKLRKATAMQSLWPSVFEHGAAKLGFVTKQQQAQWYRVDLDRFQE